MPQVVIIAGPNGAGKTMFASEYFAGPRGHFVFINADEIAREVGPLRQRSADIRAARIMLERIDGLVAASDDFALETTLATLFYARKIPAWRKSG